jgi:peptidoglycan/LPS O-acetylase OafA/YrhL
MSNQYSQLEAGINGNVQGVPMRKEFSIYLDFIRFMAALLVAISHSNNRALISDLVPFTEHSRAAVIIFFILSGYVISFVTSERERTPIEYWSSRLSRFYMLVIPVVLLTPVLDAIGQMLGPQFYDGKTTHGLVLVRILTSLTYMNEVWNLSIMSFSNVPFWSLCYEMWYYAMFAVFAFAKGRVRTLLLAACALVVGPKILVLAPIWVLGVVLHRWRALERIPEAISWILFFGSFGLYALFQHYDLSNYGYVQLGRLIGTEWAYQFAFSRCFITDYPLALIVAANFVGFRNIAGRFGWLLIPLERPIRWTAGLTFPLYIIHQPLLLFFSALINGDPQTPVFYFEVVACTLATVAIAGAWCEKYRKSVKRWIKGVLQGLSARFTGDAAGKPLAQ